MPSNTIKNVKAGLKGIRGAGDALRGKTMETTDQTFDSQPNHPETKSSSTKNRTIAEKGQQDVRYADEMLARHSRKQEEQADEEAPVPAANYDEAPPGQPGPDFSGVSAAAGARVPPLPSSSSSTINNKKPIFTRGPSVMDGTAVTSAAPTPAGEIPNPMAYNSVATAQRQRESHLPDLDIRDADVYGNGGAFGEEPTDEIEGTDEFAPELSRQETVRARRGTMTQWEG